MKRRKLRRRLLALEIGAAVGLLLAEMGVRVFRALTDGKKLAASQMTTGAQRGLPPGAKVALAQIVRAAKNPSIVYELVPDLDVTFETAPLVTNADGFVGPPRTHAKPANGFRVVGIGDSVLFGWGVPYESCGLAVLERKLQAALPDRIVETVDTGVPGYNTAMEEHVLRDKGLAYAPDVVLVDFVGNDFDLPDFLWDQPDYLALDRSFLFELVRRVRWQRDWKPGGPFVWAPHDPTGRRFEYRTEHVPEPYRHLVGPDAYRRAMTAITALGRERGFRVLVTCHHRMLPQAVAVCEDLGVPISSPLERLQQWLHEHGDIDYLASPLVLSERDPHPSAILHGMWADAAFERMRELDWLPR